jgi:hypothetical protein
MTAGLTVLILARVTPFVVPAPVCVINANDAEVAVSVFVELFLNLKANAPDTLNVVGVPPFNWPNPNNCESLDEETVVVPTATLVYVL